MGGRGWWGLGLVVFGRFGRFGLVALKKSLGFRSS
jgi:hypothetical protein